MSTAFRIASVGAALLALSAGALAAGGAITSIATRPNAPVSKGEAVKVIVGFTQGNSGIACNMRWALKNSDNFAIYDGKQTVKSQNDAYELFLNFYAPSTPGKYVLEATPAAADNQNVACLGQATMIVTVKDPNAISSAPPTTMITPTTPQLPGHVTVPKQRAN